MTTSSSASMCSCAMYTLANGNMCNTATQRWINRRFSVSCLFFLSFWCFLWVFVVENCENRISIWRQTILLCARVAVGLLSRQLTYADDEYTHTHTLYRDTVNRAHRLHTVVGVVRLSMHSLRIWGIFDSCWTFHFWLDPAIVFMLVSIVDKVYNKMC